MRSITRLLGVAVLVAWPLLSTAAPAAAAPEAPCPDIETVFARGTDEEPGVGPVGQAFADSLRSKVGDKSVAVYAVNYPATDDWPTGVDGVRDASAHIEATAAACPKTKMVLGGYSQGAAVMGFVTANAIPYGVDAADVPQPMPAEVAEHVAAVVLFGTPNERAMNFLGQPLVVLGPLYAGKTIQLCVPGDVICSDAMDFAAHTPENYSGMVDQGASYAAAHLDAQPTNETGRWGEQ